MVSPLSTGAIIIDCDTSPFLITSLQSSPRGGTTPTYDYQSILSPDESSSSSNKNHSDERNAIYCPTTASFISLIDCQPLSSSDVKHNTETTTNLKFSAAEQTFVALLAATQVLDPKKSFTPFVPAHHRRRRPTNATTLLEVKTLQANEEQNFQQEDSEREERMINCDLISSCPLIVDEGRSVNVLLREPGTTLEPSSIIDNSNTNQKMNFSPCDQLLTTPFKLPSPELWTMSQSHSTTAGSITKSESVCSGLLNFQDSSPRSHEPCIFENVYVRNVVLSPRDSEEIVVESLAGHYETMKKKEEDGQQEDADDDYSFLTSRNFGGQDNYAMAWEDDGSLENLKSSSSFADPFPSPTKKVRPLSDAAEVANNSNRVFEDVPKRRLSFTSMSTSSLNTTESDGESLGMGDAAHLTSLAFDTPPLLGRLRRRQLYSDSLPPLPADLTPSFSRRVKRNPLNLRKSWQSTSRRLQNTSRQLRNTSRRIRRIRLDRPRRPPRSWLIPADHPLKVAWDVCTVLLSAISALFTHFSIRDRNYDRDAFGVIRFCEVWFLVDIVLNFVTQHRSGRRVLFSAQSVWGRYLTTWFAIDVISFLPWEKILVKPIVEMQKRRSLVQKLTKRSKVVFKVTRMLRGRHVKWFQHVAKHSKRAGVGSRRLLELVIRYIPKYFTFCKNMRAVLAVRMLRQIHWFRKVLKNSYWKVVKVQRRRRRKWAADNHDDDQDEEYHDGDGSDTEDEDDDGSHEEEDEHEYIEEESDEDEDFIPEDIRSSHRSSFSLSSLFAEPFFGEFDE